MPIEQITGVAFMGVSVTNTPLPIKSGLNAQGFTQYPDNADIINGASGNVANAIATATLGAVAGKTTYITGFEVTAAGATGALVVIVTVTGTISGTLSYIFVFPAGAAIAAQPLIVEFPMPIPANAQNQNIQVSLPAGGAGNTNAAVVAHGFRV